MFGYIISSPQRNNCQFCNKLQPWCIFSKYKGYVFFWEWKIINRLSGLPWHKSKEKRCNYVLLSFPPHPTITVVTNERTVARCEGQNKTIISLTFPFLQREKERERQKLVQLFPASLNVTLNWDSRKSRESRPSTLRFSAFFRHKVTINYLFHSKSRMESINGPRKASL